MPGRLPNLVQVWASLEPFFSFFSHFLALLGHFWTDFCLCGVGLSQMGAGLSQMAEPIFCPSPAQIIIHYVGLLYMVTCYYYYILLLYLSSWTWTARLSPSAKPVWATGAITPSCVVLLTCKYILLLENTAALTALKIGADDIIGTFNYIHFGGSHIHVKGSPKGGKKKKKGEKRK